MVHVLHYLVSLLGTVHGDCRNRSCTHDSWRPRKALSATRCWRRGHNILSGVTRWRRVQSELRVATWDTARRGHGPLLRSGQGRRPTFEKECVCFSAFAFSVFQICWCLSTTVRAAAGVPPSRLQYYQKSTSIRKLPSGICRE